MSPQVKPRPVLSVQLGIAAADTSALSSGVVQTLLLYQTRHQERLGVGNTRGWHKCLALTEVASFTSW